MGIGGVDIVDLGPLGWLVAIAAAALLLLVVVAIVVRRSMGGMGSDIDALRRDLKTARMQRDSSNDAE